jgi:ssDNA-binding Zn-finger/Zn-ribbon topoisomerase 1
MSSLKCPTCNHNIIYHRIDDGESKIIIKGEYEVEEIYCNSNGSTRIYCSNNEAHKIPNDLQDKIIIISEGFGY